MTDSLAEAQQALDQHRETLPVDRDKWLAYERLLIGEVDAWIDYEDERTRKLAADADRPDADEAYTPPCDTASYEGVL